MTFSPKDSIGEYLSTNVVWPNVEESSEFNNRLQQIYRSITDTVNCREIANYLGVTPSSAGGTTDIESLTGQQWFGSVSDTQSEVPRTTYRKVINFGILPNTGITSIAHGIIFDASTTMTKIYGSSTDPVGLNYIPIPFVSTVLAGNISITVDATNVNISTGSDRTSFTRTIIVLEYLKN